MKLRSTNQLPAPPNAVKLPSIKSKAPKPMAKKPAVNVAPLSQLIPEFGQPVGVTMPKMGTGNRHSIPASKGPSGMRGSKY